MERLKTLHKQGAISMAISDAHFERRLEELCDEDGATTAAADTADSAIDVERTTGDAASGKRAATGSPPVSPAKPKPIGDDDDDDESGDDDSDSDDDDEEAPAKPQETVKVGLKRFKGLADGQESVLLCLQRTDRLVCIGYGSTSSNEDTQDESG